MKSISSTVVASVVFLYGSAAMAQVGSAFISPRATSLVTIAAAPSTASVPYGFTQQFTATVAGTTNTGVNWTVNGVNGGNNKFGTISTWGLYTAPTLHGNSTPASVTITAVSTADPTKSASAIVTFTTGVSVAITPSSASVQVGAIQQFTAVVTGTSNTAVTWAVNGVSGGNSIAGSISASGLYTAPAMAPASAVIIAAVSAIDPSKSAQATVTVLSGVLVSISPITVSVPVGQTQSFAATITGTSNTAVTWAVNGSTGGNLTLGTISSSGLYTAPATVPTATVSVAALSAADPTKSAQAIVSVLSAVAITTAALPGGIVGSSYSATLAATGGVAPYTWSISSGLLPSGCSLTTTSGMVSGTPTTAGSYNAVMSVTDSAGQQSSKSLNIVIAAALAITTATIPSGTVGAAYSATLSAAGGSLPYTWSLVSGQLPSGVNLTSSGTISGTPSTAGSFNFMAQVADGAGRQATKSLSWPVYVPLAITTASLPNGTTGVAYSATLPATGGATPYTWSVASGQLPPGLTFSALGVLSGSPTTSGAYAFSAQVTDSIGATVAQPYLLTIASTSSAAAPVTDNFDRPSLGANWTIAFGAMTLVNNAYTSDKPNYPQDSAAFWNASSFTANHYAQATLNLPETTSYAGVLVRGSVNSGYFCLASASFMFLQKMVAGVDTQLGNSNTYTFKSGDVMRLDVYGTTIRCLINGAVKLSATDSDLSSGSPGIAGSYATHTATGDNWSAGDWTGTPLTITTASWPDAAQNSSYLPITLSSSGGISPITWSLLSGAMPTGLNLNPGTGVISGTPTTLGNYTFTIQVADSSSPQKTANKVFTLVVNQNDMYGGSTLITGTNTGYWHTDKINGNWWFIDPLGNAMHFVAPYNVGRGDGGTLNGSTMAVRINTKYSTDNNNWTCAYLPSVVSRLKTWGFTGVGGGSDSGMTPLQQNSCWGFDAVLNGYYMQQQYRMPTVFYYQTSFYAMSNTPQTFPIASVSPLDQPVKSFNYGLNSYLGYSGYVPGAGEPDYSDSRLYSYFDYLIPNSSGAAYFAAPAAIRSYVIGASIDEADQVYSFTTGGRNPAFYTGWDHSHGGLRALRTSPLQYANRTKLAIYPDGAVYVKSAATRNYLKGVYGTIAALNTAWGSTYSACDMEGAGDQFGSCGTKVTAEAFATANGTSSAYTHTLASAVPSWHSIAVYVGGSMVAGDLGYNASDGDIYAAPGTAPSAPSKFYGPLIDTSSSATNFVNYTSATGTAGTVGIKFKTGSAALASVAGNGSVVTVKTQTQHGSWPGAHVAITGTISYNLTGTIASVMDSYTFTITSAATGGSQFDAGSVAFTDISPPNGTAITISYVTNGWGLGDGLMDEDGRHSNCLGASNNDTNGKQLNLCSGTGTFANAQIAIDLDGVLGKMATDYFSNMNTTFGKHFGNGNSRMILNLGPDPLIYSVSPPAPGVLQAAGQYTDVIALASYTADGSTFYQMTQTKLDYIRQYAGDKPLLNADFLTAEADSALRASSPTAGAQDFPTQEARGSAYLALIKLLTSLAYTSGGSKPYIGTQFWQWSDSLGEKLNWGLVTPYDNAYDGHESVTNVLSCSAPIQSYACGGEQYKSGDFISSTIAANALWR